MKNWETHDGSPLRLAEVGIRIGGEVDESSLSIVAAAGVGRLFAVAHFRDCLLVYVLVSVMVSFVLFW